MIRFVYCDPQQSACTIPLQNDINDMTVDPVNSSPAYPFSNLSQSHITFTISLPSSLHDPVGHRHWSLSFTHKISRVSKSLTALFGMWHITYGTNFLHLFAFLVSRPPQSALLHCQAPTLLLNRWLACLTGSSTLVLKLAFSPDPFPSNLPLSLTD